MPPKNTGQKGKTVDSRIYTQEYYLAACDGFVEFNESGGKELGERLKKTLSLVALKQGMKVLDIGCGRGELVCFLASQGIESTGIDYAKDAIVISQKTAAKLKLKKAHFLQASGTKLDFKNEMFDLVFLNDVVEHLYPHELAATLSEANRVLKKGGKLAVHTMPNAFVSKPGYFFLNFMGQHRGPLNPLMHVNEQTPFSLSRNFKDAGFSEIQTKLELNGNWFRAAVAYPKIKWLGEPVVRFLETKPLQWLAEKTPIGTFISTDIFMTGTKR